MAPTDCILGWGKPDKTNGYLRVSVDNKLYYAHRLAYIAANGAVPQGYHVHHKCGNKACVNPTHLVALSQAEHFEIHTKPKSADYYANQRYCKNGHEFDGMYRRKNGQVSRTCSVCRKASARKWYLNKKESKNVVR